MLVYAASIGSEVKVVKVPWSHSQVKEQVGNLWLKLNSLDGYRIHLLCLVFCSVWFCSQLLEIEHRPSHMLGKSPSTELSPQPCVQIP